MTYYSVWLATGVTKRRSGAPCGRIWPLWRQIGASPRLDLVGKHQIRCFPRRDLAVECQIWLDLGSILLERTRSTFFDHIRLLPSPSPPSSPVLSSS
ncbi:Uncharacterized protein TCM_046022 [Theobroma cacao]|uniref:Uncharacterized protein n=1 Tax=Theobroma cacao TaxID=3641 RepID=S1SIE4_THECC|nr:Uncharacterized protein TCM_046022 [Theobroma cacao]